MLRPLPSIIAALSLGGLCLAPTLAQAGATASTYKKVPGKAESTYSPPNAIDNDAKTFWMEGAEGAGDGSWIQLDVPRAKIDKIRISGGHLEDERMYLKYSRMKDITLDFYSVEDDRSLKSIKQVSATLEDKPGWKEITIEDVVIGGELFGGAVKVTFTSSYPGRDFTDLVLSEVEVILEEFPAQTAIDKVSSNTAQKDNLNDGNPKKTWTSEGAGVGQEIIIDAPDYGLAGIIVTPTKAKGAVRAKEIQIDVGSLRLKHTLEDNDKPQHIVFPMTNGYNGGHFGRATIKVLSVHGAEDQPVSFGNFRIMATNYSI